MTGTVIVPSDYFIVVCTDYPRLLELFPDGFPFVSAIADVAVSADGTKAATMAAVRKDTDLAEHIQGMPLVAYPWTASAFALAKSDHPTIPWSEVPRFSGQPTL